MQGEQGADLEDLEARVGTEDVVDDEHPVAVEGADPNGLVGASGQRLRIGERAGAQLAQIEVAVRELEELWAQLVLVAVGVLLDETVRLERPQQAVDRALGEPEAVRELADSESPGAAGEGFEDADCSIDGLDHWWLLSNGVRHCRMRRPMAGVPERFRWPRARLP